MSRRKGQNPEVRVGERADGDGNLPELTLPSSGNKWAIAPTA